MISDEKIIEAQGLLDRGFTIRFVAERTGVSRPVCSLIRAGKRLGGEERVRKAYEKALSLRPQSYDMIVQQAREAIVKSGRESSKSLCP